jgi:hypothetical protein
MSLKKIIKILLMVGSIYLSCDALIHLFNVRLADAVPLWPSSAIRFAGFISQIYASFVLLVAVLIWEIQKDLIKYRNLATICGVWALLHGGFLGQQTLNGLADSFEKIPSLLVWTAYYPMITLFESILLIIFGTIVILWRFKNAKNN